MHDLIRTLILVGAYVAGAAGLALIFARFSDAGRKFVRRSFGGTEMWFAFAVALAMSLSSLYFSEILDYDPCRLCWFQRVCAYPIVIILGWAAARRDRNGWAPAITLAGIGIAVSTWHIMIDTIPSLETGSCDPLVPCTVRWQGFDQPYSTIQVGAFCCFLFIIGISSHALAKPTPIESSTSPAEA